MTESNPLLSENFRIPFDRIRPEHVQQGIHEILRIGQERVDAVARDDRLPAWENTLEPLDRIAQWVDERIKPVGHLLAVNETGELLEAFNVVLPEISGFWTHLPLNAALWQRIRALAESEEGRALTGIRHRHLDKTLTEFRRAGADIDDEALRPYFPLEAVMDGMFGIVERVFGVIVRRQERAEVWHPDVRYYEIHDEDGTFLGGFYTDWYPRKEKRQGAWMNDLRSGGPLPDGSFELHLGVICGNFTPPQGDEPSLLTHREVETVFHEFGHLLHHCASRVPVRARRPQRGVGLGGAAQPVHAELDREFMGRDPDPAALLERNLGPAHAAA